MLLLSQREQNKQGEARAGSITQSVGTFFAPWPLSQLCLCSFLHITPKCKSLWCYQDPSVCWGKSYCSPSPECLFIPALVRLLCPYCSFIHSLTHLDDVFHYFKATLGEISSYLIFILHTAEQKYVCHSEAGPSLMTQMIKNLPTMQETQV